MNLKELIYREEYNYSVEELIYVVTQYIKLRKNVDVNIRIDTIQIPTLYMWQVEKLQQAFEDAQEWYKTNYKF